MSARPWYDRIASLYDVLNPPDSWRQRLWSGVQGEKILEIGVGTGKNIPCYLSGASLAAIDISEKMLEKAARRKTLRQDIDIALCRMDAAALAFKDNTFDVVISSYVLMTFEDPSKALIEMKRVCKPEGKLLLLEFTRSKIKWKSVLQNLTTPIVKEVYHASFNRDIEAMIEANGFEICESEAIVGDLVKIFKAKKK